MFLFIFVTECIVVELSILRTVNAIFKKTKKKKGTGKQKVQTFAKPDFSTKSMAQN